MPCSVKSYSVLPKKNLLFCLAGATALWLALTLVLPTHPVERSTLARNVLMGWSGFSTNVDEVSYGFWISNEYSRSIEIEARLPRWLAGYTNRLARGEVLRASEFIPSARRKIVPSKGRVDYSVLARDLAGEHFIKFSWDVIPTRKEKMRAFLRNVPQAIRNFDFTSAAFVPNRLGGAKVIEVKEIVESTNVFILEE